MIVTYTPEGEEAQRFEFIPDKVRANEAELIEKRFGGTFTEFRAGVTQGNVKARKVLLWHLLKRTHHTLRYEDVPDFAIGELVCENDRRELAEMRDRIAKSNHPRREELMSALDVEIEDAPEAGEPAGKAESKANA